MWNYETTRSQFEVTSLCSSAPGKLQVSITNEAVKFGLFGMSCEAASGALITIS